VSWTRNYPPGRDRWDLVATYARQRGQTTLTLVNELLEAGARPEQVAGAWMVRNSEWQTFEPRLRTASALAPLAALQEAQRQTSAAADPTLADALQRQAAMLEQLRSEIETLSRQLAEESHR
jgi:hypothetical protein